MTPGASSSPAASTPIPRTRLIGRDTERNAARLWLLDEAVPLLTLSGPGGVGKTRLALAIASDVAETFADGVVWVDLSALNDPALTPNAVAAALGVVTTLERPAERVIIDHLRSRQLLLLLDNCEHLLTATAELVAAILASCPAVQVLATSRARLRVRGEQVLPVEPLPLPAAEHPGFDDAAESEAVRLFVERARAARPDFALTATNADTVSALCRQLDGLPLAIELAAARTAGFPPEMLLALVTSRLPLLGDGPHDVPPRQQTMRATIAWSYDLLDPEAQALFSRLSVFTGGFTLDAVRAVWMPGDGTRSTGDDAALSELGALLEFHLVRRTPDDGSGEPRFAMLETVREFGLEQLDAHGEESDARTRHARYFLTLVDDLEAKVAPHLPEASQVFARLQVEYPNLRAALGWFIADGMTEEAVSLAGWLSAFWLHFGYTQEGRQWLERVLAMAGEVSAAARVWALVGLFTTFWTKREDETRAMSLIEEAIQLARDSGDPLSIGLATEWGSICENWTGDIARGERLMREARAAFAALPPAPWVERNLTQVDWALGHFTVLRGDIPGSEERLLEVVARQRVLEREHGAPYSYTSDVHVWLGHIALVRGDTALALGRYQHALHAAAPVANTLDILGIVSALCGAAGALATAGRWASAARLFGATEAICARTHINFSDWIFGWQRAIGLPEPWQQGELHGLPARLRSVVQDQFPRELPPLPDPAAAARFWAAGGGMSLEEAIAEADAASLETADPHEADRLPPTLTLHRFGLSRREREVLALLCQRLSDAEIGEALSISPRTASSHVAHIYDKLGVSSRREAAALAARHGLAWDRAGVPTEAAP
jgi:predicted ATPase/DNA-binding CsgD family transcriptional regulator